MPETQSPTVYELAITADGFLTVHEGDEIPESWQGEIVTEDEPQTDDEGDQS